MKWRRFQKKVKLPGTPEAVWPLLANTDLLNREMGLPQPTFVFTPRKDGGTRARGAAKLAGITLTYDEHPFDWHRPYQYSVKRDFDHGPIRSVRGSVVLQPDGDETEVTTVVELLCAPGAGPIAKVFALKSIGDFVRACDGFEKFLSNRAPTAYQRESTRPPADRERLEAISKELVAQGIPQNQVEALASFLRDSAAGETVLFRPGDLAERLGMARRDTLNLCLAATSAGMLDLSWRVMCPYCGGNQRTMDHLSDLGKDVHCESCAIAFDSAFDENVEVLFTAAHAVRPVMRSSFCIGGPHLAPQVVMQCVLAPGESRLIDNGPPPRSYRLFSLQIGRPTVIEAAPGLGVRLTEEGIEAGAAANWTIENATARDVVLRIELADGRSDVVTAAEVTSLAMFRERFSAEVLSPGTEIAVRNVCVMFTDVKGSTEMYRERGDAPSYAAVRRHFERLEKAIADHGGAIVKTIGDAVMATFHDPCDGLRAALAIQDGEDELVTKIGLHAGPAITVNANGILDYFGHTVNLAARLQKHSQGGDVVIPEAFAEDPRVAEVLAQCACKPLTANLSGIGQDLSLVRVCRTL